MADTPRMTALRNLSKQLPVANQRLAQGQAAARDLQLQQAVAKAPVAAPVTSTAQQTGGALAQQAGAQQSQAAQQGVQQAGQVGQLGLAESARQQQADIASQQAGVREQQMGQAERFAKLNEGLKKQLYDDQMKFQKDELGRTQFNEVQLADYARANAKSDEQLRNYSQRAQQLSKRKQQMMEHAHKMVMADLDHKHKMAEKSKDQESIVEIEMMKRGANEQMAKQAAKAANTAAMWQTGGTIAGGVAGAVFGGPAGAAIGAQVGGAVGGLLGGGGGGGGLFG